MEWAQLLNGNRRRKSRAGDHRTEFERDYDRTVFSPPVRRLQDKAQVFPLEPHDAVRTRLTHSMEVSATARGLAKRVTTWMLGPGNKIPKKDAAFAADIQSIAATCGIFHDLGNPPFGHAGELAVVEWFHEQLRRDPMFFDDFDKDGIKGRESQLAQDFLQFDGNAQTLRLLMKLQVLSDEYGLNLTFGTLSAACKYVVASNSVDRKKAGAKKPGFFASEAAEIEEIRHQTGTNGARNPITFLVEASDDICYSTVDIEDGITKGVLNWRTFKDELRKRSKGGVNQQTIKDLIERTERTINQASMKPDGEAVDTAHAQVLRTSLIGLLVEAAATRFAKEYNRIMEGTYDEDLLSGSDAAEIAKILKDIGREIVYCSKETLALELRGRRVIHDLMDVFYEGVCVPENKPKPKTFPGKAYNLLSNNYRVVFKYCIKNDPMPLKYRRLQLLTDYIAGMTDTFACSLHRQLTNGGCGERS